MPMPDSAIAEHVKNELIDQYVRLHPGVSKNEVATRCKNGQLVTDSISKIMADIESRSRIKDAQKSNAGVINEHINEYLCVEPDERYKQCQDSSKHSKTLVDFLFQSTKLPFGLTEKKQTLDFLKNRLAISGSAVRDLTHCKDQLAELMDNDSFKQSVLKTVMSQYLHSGASQLKAQVAIFNKEVELGNFYADKAKDLMKTSAGTIKDTIDNKTKILIRDVYALLIKSEMPKVDLTKLKQGHLNEALTKYEARLDMRIKQVQGIQMVIQLIESVLAELEKAEEEKKTKKEEKKSSGNRMAFAKKLFSKFGM